MTNDPTATHTHTRADAGGEPPAAGNQRLRLRTAIGGAVLVALLCHSAMVSVREQHTALVTRFGRLARTLDEPGLHWKLPWPIEAEVQIDRRLVIDETPSSEVLTRDRRSIVLASFVAWRVAEPERYFRSLGGNARATEVLGDMVYDAKRRVLGLHDLSALVSTNRDELRTDAIEAEILAVVAGTAREQYGIAIERVGFERLSFPESNIGPVFDQMRAEREKVAKAARAIGEANAEAIRKETDRRVSELITDAIAEAKGIRGEAEALIAERIAAIEDLDPDFFAYMLKLDSIEELINENTEIFLQTGQVPFDIFNERPDRANIGAPATEGSGN